MVGVCNFISFLFQSQTESANQGAAMWGALCRGLPVGSQRRAEGSGHRALWSHGPAGMRIRTGCGEARGRGGRAGVLRGAGPPRPSPSPGAPVPRALPAGHQGLCPVPAAPVSALVLGWAAEETSRQGWWARLQEGQWAPRPGLGVPCPEESVLPSAQACLPVGSRLGVPRNLASAEPALPSCSLPTLSGPGHGCRFPVCTRPPLRTPWCPEGTLPFGFLEACGQDAAGGRGGSSLSRAGLSCSATARAALGSDLCPEALVMGPGEVRAGSCGFSPRVPPQSAHSWTDLHWPLSSCWAGGGRQAVTPRPRRALPRACAA